MASLCGRELPPHYAAILFEFHEFLGSKLLHPENQGSQAIPSRNAPDQRIHRTANRNANPTAMPPRISHAELI